DLPISRKRIVIAVAACAASSALMASATLDHARAQVPPAISGLVHSSTQTAETKPAVVPPPTPARKDPGVLLAQATAAPPAPQGRIAPPSDSAEKERQLEDAFSRSEPTTDMTIAMEINYFQSNRSEYFVPVTVKISGRELALALNGGAARTSF